MKSKEYIISKQDSLAVNLEEDISVCMQQVIVGYTDVNYYDKCEAKKRRKERQSHRQQIRNGDIERTGFGEFLYRITTIFRKTK
jgi:hypothetical protein